MRRTFYPSLTTARTMIDAAMDTGHHLNLKMALTICDGGGHVVASARMDGASPLSVKIAGKKAYTAAISGFATHDLTELVQPGNDLFGLTSADSGRLIAFGGGFPLCTLDGEIVGGVGASGGAVPQDIEVARSALRIWRSNAEAHAGPSDEARR